MLETVIVIIMIYLYWISFLCRGLRRGSIRANNPIQSAESIGWRFFVAGMIFFILHLIFGGISSLLNIPATIQAAGGVPSFLLIIIVGLLVFSASSVIPGYVLGYYVAKEFKKSKNG